MAQFTTDKPKWRRMVGVLPQVNTFWRTTALGTPHLWCTITTCWPFDAERDVPLAKMYLERAKGLPTTFVLRDIRSVSAGPVAEVFKAMAPTLHTLIFESKWPPAFIFERLRKEKVEFQYLRRLKASRSRASRHAQKRFLALVVALEQVYIKTQEFADLGRLWSQVTDFEGPFMTAETVPRIFFRAQSLCRCSLDIIFQDLGAPVQNASQHHALRTLSLTLWSPHAGLPSPLDHFPSFTNLEHFTIVANESSSVPISPFLVRSGASLLYLQVSGPFPVGDLILCLRYTPRLRFLYFKVDDEFQDDFVKCLVYYSISPILPELEVLSIKGELRLHPTTLWDVVTSRNCRLDLDPFHLSARPRKDDPPIIRPLSHIILSEEGSLEETEPPFVTVVTRLDQEYGVTLQLRQTGFYDLHRRTPQRDARDLLGFTCLDSDMSWNSE